MGKEMESWLRLETVKRQWGMSLVMERMLSDAHLLNKFKSSGCC